MLYRIILILLTSILFTQNAIALPLENRIQQYPQWDSKPPTKIAKGDLYYPDWMAGTWKAESILKEQIAPLAPEVITPGFNDNQQYIEQPVTFLVRFETKDFQPQKSVFFPQLNNNKQNFAVADRVFNGTNIAAAYLGTNNVLKVKVDPENVNRQLTLLQGDRKLISIVIKRATETPTQNRFITTEVTKQLFESPARFYLNEVETTSDYQLIALGNIQAQQFTAIYLSPQDPDYFKAINRPVAIYRYQLNLKKEGN
jgi:hypothetical protein